MKLILLCLLITSTCMINSCAGVLAALQIGAGVISLVPHHPNNGPNEQDSGKN